MFLQKVLCRLTFVSFFFSALLAPFLFAHAVSTLVGPTDNSIDISTPLSVGPINAVGYSDLVLKFDYEAESLDSGDSFVYGWSSGGTNYELGSTTGKNEVGIDKDGDETGYIEVSLPPEAVVSNLELYFIVNANVLTDVVNITNLSLLGTEVVLDVDADDDGVDDDVDNCVYVANPEQIDLDNDGIGDACDDEVDVSSDADDDGVDDDVDNCVYVANPEQIDLDNDGIGDDCDDEVDVSSDEDGDGVDDSLDLCFETVADSFENWGRSQGRYMWDGSSWVATEKGSAKFEPDMEYTYGCSATQILDELYYATGDYYTGHYKHGITKSVLEYWRYQAF